MRTYAAASVAVIVALAGCGKPSQESMVSPVRGFVNTIRAGDVNIASYRSYVSRDVADADVEEWIGAVLRAVQAFGAELLYRIEPTGEDRARIRVTFAYGSEPKPAFEATVAKRNSGWWIVEADLADLDVGGASPSFAVGGSGRSGGRRRSR
ncbi:MAG: hypothetical protein HYY17_05820 [Planctomycetes bacterium]|nr:hypothetical protein [Planctomycetota bacterium]